MTTTTTRGATHQQAWPSRREREGGSRTGRAAAPVRPVVQPATDAATERAGSHHARHLPSDASADPTVRIPAVPRQRSAPLAVPSRAVLPSSAPAAVGSPPSPVSAPVQTAWQPAPASPRPPRPGVGSGLGHGGTGHRVDGRIRRPRNGLGLAALCLGLVALPLGLLPITAFLAAGLGVLALTYGVAGRLRVRSGSATNPGSAVTGAVLGLMALVIGVAGTVAFFQNPERPFYDVTAITMSVGVPSIGE